MTYNYATTYNSAIYHIVKPGRVYSLCGVWVKTGKFIARQPPDEKKECTKCAKMLQEQTGNASIQKP